jgi:hypothetical protein
MKEWPMADAWIVVLGLAWVNPSTRTTGPLGDVLKIERVEVASEADCLRAAKDWTYTNRQSHNNGDSLAFATCAGKKPATADR